MCTHYLTKILNANVMRGRNFVAKSIVSNLQLLIHTYYARRKRNNAGQTLFPDGEIDSSSRYNLINGCL